MVSEISNLGMAIARLRQKEKKQSGVSCLSGRAQKQRGRDRMDGE